MLRSLDVGGLVTYVPSKGNAGDALIAAATMQVLSSMGVNVVANSPVTLVSGGGNLHPKYTCLARVIAKIPRHRRVIILPSTVTAHWDLLKEFSDLTLLAREEATFALAQLNGVRCQLCHDAAFSFDYSQWIDPGAGTLHAMRTDIEGAGHKIEAWNDDVSTISSRWWGLHDSMLTAHRFINRVSAVRSVITDRCHVAIVAGSLGKKVLFHPGNYHKNHSVFLASMTGMPNVTFHKP